MRKLKITAAFIVMLLCMLFLSSCKGIGSSKPQTDILFKTNADITYDNFEVTGTITRYGSGNWEMTINTPETLKGLVVTEKDGTIIAQLNGLNFSVSKDDLPVKSVFGLIFNAIDSAASDENAEVTTKDGIISVTGDSALGSYTVDMDETSGNYLGIRIPDKKLSAVFSDFERISDAGAANVSVNFPAQSAEPADASVSEETTAPIK